MKNIRKGLIIKIVFYCLLIGIVAFLIVYFDNDKVYFYLMVAFLSLLLLSLLLYLFSKIYIFNQNKRYSPLRDKCDPEQYLENIEKNKNKNKINKVFRECIYILDKSHGLRNLGKLDEAIENLKSYNTNSFPHINYKVLYYINLADLYIYKNDIQEAEKNLNIANAVTLETQGLAKELQTCMIANEYLIKMLKGNLSGCEEYFTKSLSEAKNLASKVEEHYNLGMFYYLNNEYSKANEHFSFVVNNGNKIFFVGLAKEKIEKLNQEIEKSKLY